MWSNFCHLSDIIRPPLRTNLLYKKPTVVFSLHAPYGSLLAGGYWVFHRGKPGPELAARIQDGDLITNSPVFSTIRTACVQASPTGVRGSRASQARIALTALIAFRKRPKMTVLQSNSSQAPGSWYRNHYAVTQVTQQRNSYQSTPTFLFFETWMQIVHCFREQYYHSHSLICYQTPLRKRFKVSLLFKSCILGASLPSYNDSDWNDSDDTFSLVIYTVCFMNNLSMASGRECEQNFWNRPHYS